MEVPKHVEFRWLGAGELDLLDENRGKDDGLVRRLVELAFPPAGPAELTSPHATIFLDRAGERVEELRRTWDPAMADQIAAHISVAYPCEADDAEEMCNRAARAAGDAIPFRLRLGQAKHADHQGWVFLEVEDLDAGWAHLRHSIAQPGREIAHVSPHVTIVHPRTTNRGPAAWHALNRLVHHKDIVVRELAVAAFDGRRWVTVQSFPLDR